MLVCLVKAAYSRSGRSTRTRSTFDHLFDQRANTETCRAKRVCIEINTMATLRVLTIVAICISYINGECKLKDIPTKENYQEEKLGGLWYEIRWYPPSRFTVDDAYNNYGHVFDFETPGRKTFYVFYSDKGECTRGKERTLTRISGTAKYTLDGNETMTIVDTDYDNFLVEFSCFGQAGDLCTEHAVNVLSRRTTLSRKVLDHVEKLVQRLCVPPDVYATTRHDIGCPKSNGNKGGPTLDLLALFAIGYICQFLNP